MYNVYVSYHTFEVKQHWDFWLICRFELIISLLSAVSRSQWEGATAQEAVLTNTKNTHIQMHPSFKIAALGLCYRLPPHFWSSLCVFGIAFGSLCPFFEVPVVYRGADLCLGRAGLIFQWQPKAVWNQVSWVKGDVLVLTHKICFPTCIFFFFWESSLGWTLHLWALPEQPPPQQWHMCCSTPKCTALSRSSTDSHTGTTLLTSSQRLSFVEKLKHCFRYLAPGCPQPILTHSQGHWLACAREGKFTWMSMSKVIGRMKPWQQPPANESNVPMRHSGSREG
jgi:hypothetical protein